MAEYFPDGHEYAAGIRLDPANRFGIGRSTASGTPMVIVANPFSTSANVEAFSLSTTGVLTLGGTSTNVAISAGMTVSSGITKSNIGSVILGATSELLGTTGLVSRLTFTGIYQVTLSTISPSAVGGTSTYSFGRYPSTAFTFSTADVFLGVTLPSSYHTTGGSTAAGGPIFGGAFPTSSGGVSLGFYLATETAALSPSTGAYIITVGRTT